MNEKSYTLKELMKMTNLSERTIRRYIREGRLKGQKIGREWHFPEEQVKELFSLKEFGSTISQQASRDVRQFLLGKYNKQKNASCCLIIDIPYKNKKHEEKFRNIIVDTVNKFKKFETMKYTAEKEIIRITLIGSMAFISTVVRKMEEYK